MKKYLFAFLGAAFLTGLFVSSGFTEGTEADIRFAEKCGETDVHTCPLLEMKNDSIVLPRTLKQGEKLSLLIFVQNPAEKTVASVRSWLKYDATVLKANDLSDENSDFELAAPDGNKIDAENGQVQIGRGATGGGKKDALLFVAQVEFEVISPQKRTTEISFVNFQKDELGETGVFTLNPGTLQPENILNTSPKALRIGLNASNGGGSDQEPPVENETPDQNIPNVLTPETPAAQLARPEGLRISAAAESTNLVWQLSDDPKVAGYFVYYSEKSGFYIRRNDVGKTNHKEFMNLTKGKTYYFAITAYDDAGRESDYSDEVYATHGVVGSESHPFRLGAGKTPDILKNTTKNTESGPAESMALAAGALGVFFLIFALRRFRLPS